MRRQAARLLRNTWTWSPPLAALLLMAAIHLTASDRHLFMLLNGAGASLPPVLWANLTIVGDTAVLLALILPVAGRSPRRMWAAIIGAVSATIWVWSWKLILDVPRPAAVFGTAGFVHLGPVWLNSAFPSGHAAAVFTLVGVVILDMPRCSWRRWVLLRWVLLRWVLFITAALVAVSRVMVGAHWPLDVLAGAVCGWLAACIGLLLSARAACRRLGRSALVLQGLLALVAAALLFSPHTFHPEAFMLQRLIASACLVFAVRHFNRLRSERNRSSAAAGSSRRAS